MCRSFSTQKFAKQSISCYKSAGEGAIRTKSSAKASKNSYNDAIVYFLLLLPSMLHRWKYASIYGYTLSKNSVNSSGEAPSPYFTPRFARNSSKSPESSSTQMPFDYMYIFLIIYTRSAGRFKHLTNTSHNFSRLILSYARYKSTKHNPIYLFVRMLCCNNVYKIRAYSIVPWCALNPACVGACKLFFSAVSVNLLFITAINNFESGGVTAILL